MFIYQRINQSAGLPHTVFFQETHGRQHGDASVLQLHGTPFLWSTWTKYVKYVGIMDDYGRY